MSNKKLILVIGATGVQGIAVIDALLASSADGTPSPYSVRALTRNLNSKQAIELGQKGVECAKGSFEDFPAVLEALKGAYGAWINTDGFTVGEMREIYAGIRIFELAKQIGTVRHYVWSNLDYSTKLGNYSPTYKVEHHDGKARVGEWMEAQISDTTEDGMTWSCVSTGPYMEMLNMPMFGPLRKREDGIYVFASPIGDGHVPMISVEDIGYFARYSFDHRKEVSGKDLKVASQLVSWDGPDGLVDTFRRVTGKKAIFKHQTIEEWMNNFRGTDKPVGQDTGKGSTTWKANFTAWWSQWRDDIIKRDIAWIRKIHPNGYTLESWMRENNYTGDHTLVLKMQESPDTIRLNNDVVDKL